MSQAASELRSFSIIVPVYNGAETLAMCLSPLINQNYPSERYEVIVMDDGSTDDTREVAQRFSVRLIQHETNRGRIAARNTGARAAAYDNLVFVDSRVIFPTNGLNLINQVEHLPQHFYVYHTHKEGWGWFNRLLMLIRHRYYRPPIPMTPEDAAERAPLLLTQDNFLRAFKGTTAFAVPRDLWLACQPDGDARHESDDTAIQRKIINIKPILKRYDVVVTYYQREKLSLVLPHLFQRGPKFASFYLRPGGAFRNVWIGMQVFVLLTLVGLIAAGVVFGPVRVFVAAAAAILLALLAVGLYLAQRPFDVLLTMIMLPLLVGAFGAGLLYGVYILGQARPLETGGEHARRSPAS